MKKITMYKLFHKGQFLGNFISLEEAKKQCKELYKFYVIETPQGKYEQFFYSQSGLLNCRLFA